MSSMDEDEDYQYAYSDDEYGMDDQGGTSQSAGQSDDDHFGGAEQEDLSARKKKQYKVLAGEALVERQNEAISNVTSVLGLSAEDAGRILRHYKWDPNRVHEEWWADTEGVREKVGLLDEIPAVSAPQRKNAKQQKAQCSICFEDYKKSQMQSAGCGHFFCDECWKGYITAAIQGGHPVLGLRCPHPECKIAVPTEVFKGICTNEESERYNTFALESFVVDNDKLTFCPGPNCAHAVERVSGDSGEALDVYCPCGCIFCFNCKEEAHRPVDCETIKKWLIKNSAESENLNWIIANTKPCPKCKRPIEKNQGCMHMTCSQCKFQFCWLCLQNWETHNEGTGGFYNCNRYETAVRQGKINEEDIKRENAKQALERYMHYYERWSENDKAKETAAKKTEKIQSNDLETLSQKYSVPTSELKYILDASLQVVDCRRILKWTYAYGFYNFDESAKREVEGEALLQQKTFFEFNQGQAESYLNKLHSLVEVDLLTFRSEKSIKTAEDWAKFRMDLVGATELTKTHFSRLVEELEKGMANMLTAYERPRLGAESLQEDLGSIEAEATGEGPSKRQSKKSKAKSKEKKATSSNVQTRAGSRSTGSQSRATGNDLPILSPEQEEELGYWQCLVCTFANMDLGADECEVCQTVRGSTEAPEPEPEI